jgi:hypothetical protein
MKEAKVINLSNERFWSVGEEWRKEFAAWPSWKKDGHDSLMSNESLTKRIRPGRETRKRREDSMAKKPSKVIKDTIIVQKKSVIDTTVMSKNNRKFDYLVFDDIYDHGQKMVSCNEEEALKDYINEFVFGTKANISEMEFFVVKLENNAKIQKYKVKYDEMVITKQR